MVKRFLLIPLMVVLVSGLIFAGCAAPAPTPAPAPAPAPEETINVRFSHMFPAGSAYEKQMIVPMFEAIKEKSKGRITYTLFAGASLNKPQDAYDAAARGIADMCYVTLGFTPGRFPLSDVLSITLAYPDQQTKTDIAKAVYDKLLYQEFPDEKVFLAYHGCGDFYYTGKKEVKTLEDMKGLKLRSPGHLVTNSIEALGAVPVFMIPADIYMSMQTGVLDGAVFPPQMSVTYKIDEVAKALTKFNVGNIVVAYVMNKGFWDKIPDDLKPIVTEEVLNAAHMNGALHEKSLNGDLEKIGENATISTLSADEEKRWYAALKVVIDQWVSDMEAKGLPGGQAVEILKEEYTKMGLSWPY